MKATGGQKHFGPAGPGFLDSGSSSADLSRRKGRIGGFGRARCTQHLLHLADHRPGGNRQHLGDFQEHNDVWRLDSALYETYERTIQPGLFRELLLR